MKIGTGAIAGIALFLNSAAAMAQSPPVRIGEISSYSALLKGPKDTRRAGSSRSSRSTPPEA